MVPIGNPLKFITRINDGCSIDFWHDWAKILLSRLVAYDLPYQIVPNALVRRWHGRLPQSSQPSPGIIKLKEDS